MFLYVFSPSEYNSELNLFTNLLVQALGTLSTLIVQHCRIVKKLTSAPYFSTQCNLYRICSIVEKGHSPVVALIEELEPS